MRYDYRELLKAKEEVENGIKKLESNMRRMYADKRNELEAELFSSGILEEYVNLVELVDKPSFINPAREYTRIDEFRLDRCEMCMHTSWLRSRYYIGLAFTFGSCGDHYDTVFFDAKESLKAGHIIWNWCNGAGSKKKITSAPKHTEDVNYVNKTRIEIMEEVINNFDNFREEILDCFNIEMEAKTNKIKKLSKEMGQADDVL